jgi:hypothetical protein
MASLSREDNTPKATFIKLDNSVSVACLESIFAALKILSSLGISVGMFETKMGGKCITNTLNWQEINQIINTISTPCLSTVYPNCQGFQRG